MVRLQTKPLWKILFFLLFYFVLGDMMLSYVFSLILHLTRLGYVWSEQYMLAVYNTFYNASLLLLGILLFKDFFIDSLKGLKGRYFEELKWVFTKGFWLLMVANIASNLLVLQFVSEESANEMAIQSLLHIAPLQIFLSAVVLAPILEELVFRVCIFSTLYEKSRVLAYLASSLAFGMIHIYQSLMMGNIKELIFLFPYSLLGAVFCYMYEKRGNVIGLMGVHMANNLFSLVISFLA